MGDIAMEMKVYNCMNPDKLHMPNNMKAKSVKLKEEKEDLVQKFKNDPNSFFPSIIPPAKPK